MDGHNYSESNHWSIDHGAAYKDSDSNPRNIIDDLGLLITMHSISRILSQPTWVLKSQHFVNMYYLPHKCPMKSSTISFTVFSFG